MRSTDGIPIACQYAVRSAATNDKVPSGITAIIGSMAESGDRVEPDDDDFRRVRAYLAPHLFLEGEEGQTYPPPTDLIDEEEWESMMALPTHVALATSSYTGTEIGTIHRLH
jgi:hypothetical protein